MLDASCQTVKKMIHWDGSILQRIPHADFDSPDHGRRSVLLSRGGKNRDVSYDVMIISRTTLSGVRGVHISSHPHQKERGHVPSVPLPPEIYAHASDSSETNLKAMIFSRFFRFLFSIEEVKKFLSNTSSK